jgi:type I restriction enzyme S subunit
MRYAFYSLRAARSYLVFLASGGGQPNISQDKLRGLRIAVPPLTDQQTISKFLDNETAKLDALIGKQEQLITTLREDRTATIVHAVTKGLNPNVEMKDSGVSWIGQVPAHWTVGKVKHGFAVTLGKMYQGQAENAEDIELPHLKAGSVTSSGLDTQNPMMCWFSPHEIRSLSLRKGDVLVVEGGAIGRCVVLDRDMTGWGFQKSLNRVRALSDDSPRFLAYVIETATESGHVSVLCGKSTIPHFTAEKLEALEWPHPSVEEQRQVVQFLDQRCAKIDALIAKATEVIETMREYRSALITSAVTGKIDVRGAA